MEITAQVSIAPCSKAKKSKSQLVQTKPTTNSWEIIFKEKTGHDFTTFYTKYHPKLTWLIKGMSITTIDAEDISNQAFIRALEKIETYNPQWHFSTWLFNIGKNMAYLYKKNGAKFISMDFEQSGEDDWTPLHTHVQHKMIDTSEADDTYEQQLQQKYKLTLKEISHLSDKYKYIIELCDIQGKSYNEISEITGLPLQTVKNRLFHGRGKLELALSDELRWINENV